MFFFKQLRTEHASVENGDLPRVDRRGAFPKSNTMSRVRHFSQSKTGNVSIIFGLMAVPFVSFAGLSIDFAAASREKSKIQTALDAAALAAGRAFQVSGAEGDAKAAAQLYFNSQTGYDLDVNEVDPGTFVLTVAANENIKTSFMAVLGAKFDDLTVHAQSKAQLVREVQGDKVEVSMMLDVTGSMRGSRIADLKTAAKDLVNIIVDDGEDSVRVALAPFSHAVNVGSHFNTMTNRTDNSGRGGNCVVERDGSERYTDAPPSAGNKFFKSLNQARSYRGRTSSYWRCPTAEMIPLTSDKGLLLSEIEDLPTHGNTGGHLGTAWAWYLISKNWSNMFPSDRAPSSTLNGVKKIAVLMSDGQYNLNWYNQNSNTQAGEICDNMKSAGNGIEIYAVGFKLTKNSSAYNRLKDCASNEAHFFPAGNGDELKAAFRAIAFNIAELRLVE